MNLENCDIERRRQKNQETRQKMRMIRCCLSIQRELELFHSAHKQKCKKSVSPRVYAKLG